LDHKVKISPFSLFFFFTCLHSRFFFLFFPINFFPLNLLSCCYFVILLCLMLSCLIASLPHLATLSCCLVISSYCLQLLFCHLVLLLWIVALLHCFTASRCLVASRYLVAIAPQVPSNPPIYCFIALFHTSLPHYLVGWYFFPSSSFARRNFELGETSSLANMKESFFFVCFLLLNNFFVFDLFSILFWFYYYYYCNMFVFLKIKIGFLMCKISINPNIFSKNNYHYTFL